MKGREYCYRHQGNYYYICPECKEIPTIDIDKLAKEAAKKREQKQRHFVNVQTWIDEATGVKYEGSFEICPDCGHRSLLYNNTRTKSKCHNPDCRTNVKTFSERLNDDWVF